MRDTQNQLQDYLLHGKTTISRTIVNTPSLSAAVRLNIYADAYRARLQKALIKTYPALYAYLGVSAFEKISHEYSNVFPSVFQSVRWFGDKVSSFLHAHSYYKKLPYLAELAHWEWACGLVFDAHDSPVLPMQAMTALSSEAWANLRLKMHHSVQRLNFSWNIVALWEAWLEKGTLLTPVLQAAPVAWVLWRRERMSQFYFLPPDEAFAMDAVLKGCTFSEWCEGLCQWHTEQEAGQRAAVLLQEWILAGMISAVEF